MSASGTTIADLAVLVRSKNAGPFWLTIDVMFDNPEAYRRVRDSEAINRAGIAQMYGRDPVDIIVVNHDAALAIKVSFPRPQRPGSKYDSDVYGGQQYAPLLSRGPSRGPMCRTLSSPMNTVRVPCRTKNTSSTSWVCAALPCPGGQ